MHIIFKSNRIALSAIVIACVFSAALSRAIEIEAHGASVTIAAGSLQVGGKAVTIAHSATLAVAPAPVLEAKDEALKLSPDKPAGWARGTRLNACNARDINAMGSFVPGSLEIRKSKDGEVLKEGDDYLLDSDWAHVGIGPKSKVTVQDTVVASYKYSLLRMDTIQISADGIATLKSGAPHQCTRTT